VPLGSGYCISNCCAIEYEHSRAIGHPPLAPKPHLSGSSSSPADRSQTYSSPLNDPATATWRHKLKLNVKANFENSRVSHLRLQGLKPGAFELWLNWIQLGTGMNRV
jgi:hypothetical protein